MKLYVAFDRKNCPLGKAFTSYEKAVQYYAWDNYCDAIQEIDLPFIGRNVYYAKCYFGFNYDFYTGVIFDNIISTDIFPNKELVKNTKLWKSLLDKINENPNNYIVSNEQIASYDAYEKIPFTWGDVFENKFNARIYKIRVDKSK